MDLLKLSESVMGRAAENKETMMFKKNGKPTEEMGDNKSDKGKEEEDGGVRIPLYRWLMHGAVMFGREFCYAMETALVTPVLLQIGLPEQYYSLTWFLSPVLGLLFTPVIGSASDGCTLRCGRRRPFILALCVGVLLGMALFLNGSLLGLSIGDRPNNQLIGIILTVVGVVVLDFCADASDGPIRAYLLDVADSDEQDMALNIHAFSAGLGGAVGYMLGGLDWSNTALGQAFYSQQQVLFLFVSIFFIISVILHMLSIPESQSQSSLRPVGHILPVIHVIPEEDASAHDSFEEDKNLGSVQGDVDFLMVDRVRSKSDSILAMPDATIELDPDLDPSTLVFWSEDIFHPQTQGELDDAFKPSDPGNGSSSHPKELLIADTEIHVEPVNQAEMSCGTENLHLTKMRVHVPNASVSPRVRAPSFYRQPSFTFSYYSRVGLQRSRLRRTGLSSPVRIKTSRSLNDLTDIKRPFRLSSGSLSSESSSSEEGEDKGTTVRLLWQSMFKMPTQLWRLCVCHLLTWFAYIAQSVFYTDFMGQVVFNGDPTAPANSTELQSYHRGVQMGCWGLVVYAATSAVCSAILQKYLDNYDLSVKVIYIVGTLTFSVGAAVMAIFPNVYVVMVMISSMGVISMSISYCPYALLGQYHEIKAYILHSPANTRRGFGIDCAILSCQVYISQILVASALGSVVDAVGSVRVIPVVASGGAFLGFLAACFLVIYPDLEPSSSEVEQEELVCSPGEEEQSNDHKSPVLNRLCR
uniref:Solute carrier family 45 member 4-like n=1 Tax=Gouania willdenowi TaxID=441366 RepID=A0A8C5EI68_GOUWI